MILKGFKSFVLIEICNDMKIKGLKEAAEWSRRTAGDEAEGLGGAHPRTNMRAFYTRAAVMSN